MLQIKIYYRRNVQQVCLQLLAVNGLQVAGMMTIITGRLPLPTRRAF